MTIELCLFLRNVIVLSHPFVRFQAPELFPGVAGKWDHAVAIVLLGEDRYDTKNGTD